MVSHKKVSGFTITLGAGGLRFKKKPSRYNNCIKNAIKSMPKPKGRQGVISNFTAAVSKCKK